MMLVEMVARVCKHLCQLRLRGAILHFRSVGATAIDDQMNGYTTNLLSNILGFTDKSLQFLNSKIRPALKLKYNFDLKEKEFFEIPRPALFLAIQFHCGMTFEDHMDYNFDEDIPIAKTRFISFHPRVKTLTGLQRDIKASSAREDSKLAYVVARHFKALGPKHKLAHTNSSASVLTFVAAHYNSTNRFEEARLYAQAAVSSAQKNHCLFGLATAQLLYAVVGLQATIVGGPEPSLLGWYGKAQAVIVWHWGANNPLTMTLFDKMSSVYHRAKDPQQAFEFHKQSLKTAGLSLGNDHVITAGYLTRVRDCLIKGWMLSCKLRAFRTSY